MILRRRGLVKREPELEMAPMIDVVFLLLVFFMVTSAFRQFETQLRSAMTEQKPDAGPQARADFENVIIDIRNRAGRVEYQCGQSRYARLSDLRRLVLSLPVEGEVFVRAEPSVPVDHPVAVIRMARDAGFRKVCFVSPGG